MGEEGDALRPRDTVERIEMLTTLPGAGELRYVLTQLGEKMSDEEVDELLKGAQIGPCVSLPLLQASRRMLSSIYSDGNVNYESFVRTILSQ